MKITRILAIAASAALMSTAAYAQPGAHQPNSYAFGGANASSKGHVYSNWGGQVSTENSAVGGVGVLDVHGNVGGCGATPCNLGGNGTFAGGGFESSSSVSIFGKGGGGAASNASIHAGVVGGKGHK